MIPLYPAFHITFHHYNSSTLFLYVTSLLFITLTTITVYILGAFLFALFSLLFVLFVLFKLCVCIFVLSLRVLCLLGYMFLIIFFTF